MAGIDDNVTVIGDWVPPNPSPRTFFSSFLGDDFSSRSFLDFLPENRNKTPLPGSEKQEVAENTQDEGDEIRDGLSSDLLSESSMFSSQKPGSQGGLAERMAARAGFNAPKLNTARIRSANLLSSSSPEVQSPYLTISPGLSPTTLLDSPVFLSNSLVQQSPTTGTFPFGPFNSRSSMSLSAAPDKNKDVQLEDVDTAPFVFKPHMESNLSYLPSTANKVASAHFHPLTLPSTEVSIETNNPIQAQRLEATKAHSHNRQEFHPQAEFPEPSSIGKDTAGNAATDLRASDLSPPSDDQDDGEGDQREVPSMVISAPSDDGCNWRKYGQKQVKGSEFPRSYYKCTHPNCQVKKKVERSLEGHITEIIYKGAHNHPKPPPNRRLVVGSSHPPSDTDTAEQHGAHAGGEPMWAGTQNGAAIAGFEGRHDGVETASPASVATEFYNRASSMPARNCPQFESADAIDVSSTLSNDEDEDDRGTHDSISLGHDENGDESESKRRKLDTSAMEMSGASRAVREPRVVVQTTSEVDILDDGYRWRKYGQKVVKGNPNPRSYYKCTNAGCTVRKHVERASHDLKSVITTYEGKHNHDVPAARNSSHISSMASSAAPAAAAQAHIVRPEPSQPHNGIARFEGPTPLGTFGLAGRQPLGPTPSFSFGMNQQGLASLAMAGLGPGQGKPPSLPIHSYIGQQKATAPGFMMSKGEPKEEPMLQSSHPVSNGSSIYHQIMSRLPLGHQL